MKKTFLSVVFIVVFILSAGAFAQSIEVISVYPKAQFSVKNISTSNFTLTFSIGNDNYLELFLTNVSTTESIKVNWQDVSLLFSGQAIKPNFKVTPPSVILPGSYVEAEIKLNNNILSTTSVISVLLPISIHNSVTTYEIRLKINLSAYTPSQPSTYTPSQPSTNKLQYPFKHLWDFPLQWGTVNFNKKGQPVSTTAGLFGVPFLACVQKNFFSPIHTGVNTYWGYDTFLFIPLDINIGADYVTSGGFYIGIGIGASWLPLISTSNGYYGNTSSMSPIYPTISIGAYY